MERVIPGGNFMPLMPEFCRSCREIAAGAARSWQACFMEGFGVKYGDVSGMGVFEVRDDVFRRILEFDWKENLEQTCRWSGKTPA